MGQSSEAETARTHDARCFPPVLLLVERGAFPLDEQLFWGVANPFPLELGGDHLALAIRRVLPRACVLNLKPWNLGAATQAVRALSRRSVSTLSVLDQYEQRAVSELTQVGGFSVLPHRDLDRGLFGAQLRAALRLSEPSARRLIRGDIELDLDSGRVVVAGCKPVSLHPGEVSILAFLMRSYGEVISPRVLYEAHHGPASYRSGCRRRVEASISRLRRALGPRRSSISTVRGRGYTFSE